MKWVVLFAFSFFVCACGEHSIRNLGQMPSRDFDGWLDSSNTPISPGVATKILMECGDPAPGRGRESNHVYEKIMKIKDFDERINHHFSILGCMEHNGFYKNGDRGSLKTSCKLYPRYAIFSACQPNAKFPERSVERRLNSWWCRTKTDREYCRKNALIPSGCDSPKKDYNNPPPECRP